MGLSTSTIAFMHAESQDAASLSSYIQQALYDFDTNNSVMSGHCTGVQTRVREFAPYAAYIHCYAHVLNLVLVDSVKSVTHASEFFALLEALYVFVSCSKIHALFMKSQQQCNPGQQPLELQKLSETRWVCRYAAVNAVCRTYNSLILTVEEVADSSVTKYSQAIEARGLCDQIKSFPFIISLITFDRILSCTKQLSDQLQSSSIDLSRASDLVLATQSLLTEYRTNTYWEKVYNYATSIASLHDVPIEVQPKKRRRRPAHLTDNLIYESVGSRITPSTSDQFRVELYYPVLDKFLHELNHRFQDRNATIMKGISTCSPTASNYLSLSDLQFFSDMYIISAGPALEVEVNLVKTLTKSTIGDTLASFRSNLYSCQPAYSILHQLTQIALTIAVTSVESECSFSALKRIKTRLRSSMAEDRLSALATLSIEREIAENLDFQMIIDEFGSADNNRRIVLT